MIDHKKREQNNFSNQKDITIHKEELDITKNEQSNNPNVETVNIPLIGIVTGCANLNVRTEANINSVIACVISTSSEVVIDEEKSTTDFYRVCTTSGIEGFCMKDFISIKE